MMTAWAFSCRTVDEVAALLKALGKHRYIREAELRIHWLVDAALTAQPRFAAHAQRFEQRRLTDPSLDVASYDPTLWRPADTEDVIEALTNFWSPTHQARAAADRLRALFAITGLPFPTHLPFQGDVEYPAHPQLIQLSWTLYPVCDLNAERHTGVIAAMEVASEEVDVSAPVDQEGPDLSVIELTEGAPQGGLISDFLLWADGPYSYNDYVFRGASKAAGLADPLQGAEDL